TSYDGIPEADFHSAATIAGLKGLGIPSSKLLLGIGFYGRGWTGVGQSAPGGTATGPAPGTYEPGIDDYKVLRTECPATGTVGGTAGAEGGDEGGGDRTAATTAHERVYAGRGGLAGTSLWERSGQALPVLVVHLVRDGGGGVVTPPLVTALDGLQGPG